MQNDVGRLRRATRAAPALRRLWAWDHLNVGQKSITLLVLTIRTHGDLCHLSVVLVTL